MFPKKPLIQRAVHKSLKRIKSVDFPLTTNFKKSEKSIKSIEKEHSDNFSSGAQIGNPSLEYANKVIDKMSKNTKNFISNSRILQ